MAAATDASGAPQSPRLARSSRGPWNHVVRGDTDPIPLPEQSDRSPPLPPPKTGDVDAAEHAGEAGIKKKPVWNKPANGVVEVAVMDAASWPPLSEAARASASPKPSSSSESLKTLQDGSVPAPPAPVAASPPLKTSMNNPSPNHSLNHPVHQKSMKRGGRGGMANGAPLPASTEMQQVVLDKQAAFEPFPKDASSKNTTNINNSINNGGNWEHGTRGAGFATQPHGGGDHQRGYGGDRRGSNAGGGPHHGGGGHGNRRDPERGGHEWNSRSFGGRDVHMHTLPQQRGVQRPFMRPPAPLSQAAPFITHPSVRPFVAPMGFQLDVPSMFFPIPHPPEALRPLPFVTPMVPPVFYPPPDPATDVRMSLMKQIEYYFSKANLIKDGYLKHNMDSEGWVPISLIATFPRVKQVTEDVQFILDVIRASDVVEIKGDKIRKRDGWMDWILPPAPHHYGATTAQNSDALSAHVKSMVLEEGVSHAEGVLGRSASGNFNNHIRAGDQNRDRNGQVA